MSIVPEILRSLNFSRREVDIYLGLLRKGPTTARRLCDDVRINRVDTYRVLRTLVSRGLVSITPTEPSVYEATEPRKLIKLLLAEVEQRADKIKELSPRLILELESIERGPETVAPHHQMPEFKLLQGEGSWAKHAEMLGQAKREVWGIWTISDMNQIGVLSRMIDCIKRGVDTRIISEITRKNGMDAEELLRVASVRHCPRILRGIRFTMVDGEQVSLGVSGIEAYRNPKTITSLWSSRQDFVRLLGNYFESSWKRAVDLDRILR